MTSMGVGGGEGGGGEGRGGEGRGLVLSLTIYLRLSYGEDFRVTQRSCVWQFHVVHADAGAQEVCGAQDGSMPPLPVRSLL